MSTEGTKRSYDDGGEDDRGGDDRGGDDRGGDDRGGDDRGGHASRRENRTQRNSRGGNRSPPSKRRQVNDTDEILFKVLVPSYIAGAVLGKRGANIEQVQKDTGAKMTMSKPRDFYPGTLERICLISGSTKEIIMNAHQFIMETMRDKPEPSPERFSQDSEQKVNMERHKQVKILVPNSTVGMIIGQGGKTIRQIKEDSHAWVQISQKSRDNDLVERCVTISGHADENTAAVGMVLDKIIDDPESGSCPNVSYVDHDGPVASVNPNGPAFSHAPPSYNNGGNNYQGGGGGGGGGGGMSNQGSVQSPVVLDQLRVMLQSTGYSDRAVEEISSAIYTLANYGLLGLVGIDQGMAGLGGLLAGRVGQGSNTSLASLSGMLQRSMTQPAARSDPYDRYQDDRQSRNNNQQRNDYQQRTDYRDQPRARQGDRNERGGGRRY